MSYILDALKKSEQQRGHGEVPDVQTIHSSSLNYRDEKNSYWPYILIVAVFLNLIAIVYFIFDKEKVAASNTTELLTKSNSHTDTTGASEQKKVIIAPQQTNDTKTEAEETKIATTATPTINNNKPASTKNVKIETRQYTKTIATKRVEETPEEIVEFYDLADAVRLQIPTITISAHVYSNNPLHRSIVVNNKFLEEGDYVFDELSLQEITADGAIFDFVGSRFHYGVVSGWQ